MKTIKIHEHVTSECWDIIDAALAEAYKRTGNPSRLARALGIERNVLTLWKQKRRLPTIQQALAIENHVRISRKSLRPDLDWEYIDAESVPPLKQAPTAERVQGEVLSV
jgi:DNA-binding transcriptional regulator YdaS (Cro superfamily)